MSAAQQAALRRAIAADAPVKVAPSTAAVLCETYGYIEPAGALWVATAKGRARLAGDDHQARYHARKARARDGGVEVTYETAPSHPKAKAAATVTVTRSDGTVDLRAYRMARGDDEGSPAA